MAKVYELLTDYNFQGFEVDSPGWNTRPEGTPVADRWIAPDVYIERPLKPPPDIWKLPPTYAFEQSAVEILGECLREAGELLPLPFEGRELSVLNVTTVYDAVDLENSDVDEEFDEIEIYAFHPHKILSSLFKVPQTQMTSQIWVAEGLQPPEKEFKALVEKHDLKGVRFAERWSNE